MPAGHDVHCRLISSPTYPASSSLSAAVINIHSIVESFDWFVSSEACLTGHITGTPLLASIRKRLSLQVRIVALKRIKLISVHSQRITNVQSIACTLIRDPLWHAPHTLPHALIAWLLIITWPKSPAQIKVTNCYSELFTVIAITGLGVKRFQYRIDRSLDKVVFPAATLPLHSSPLIDFARCQWLRLALSVSNGSKSTLLFIS